MNNVKKELEKNGVAILRKVWTSERSEEVCEKIIQNIKICAKELDCTTEDYLKNVSRWTHPSPITNDIYELFKDSFKKTAENINEKEMKLVELNVISKSIHANSAIPCHQDISYTPQEPYQFSLWLALQDVTLEDGVLECLPGSHLDKIKPAVDFWAPNFVDKMYSSDLWQKNFIAFPVQSGDCVILDSRIWHRSDQNKSGRNRFAVVSRWSLVEPGTGYEIPEKTHSEFGIWNCGGVTRSLLQQGLHKCFKISVEDDLSTYISLWIEALSNEKKIPFKVDIPKSKKSLANLLILDRAAELHNGGDVQGIVYTRLWEYLLKPLSNWLEEAVKGDV